jgi:hypothetical protein
MPVDERGDLDRLTRTQLYQEADAWGIEYPRDCPKYRWDNGRQTGGMIALLEAHGVNRGNMKTVRWQTIYPSEQERQAAAHQGVATTEQHYPMSPQHQSARDGVDTTAILQTKLAQSEARSELKGDEVTRLKAELAELKSQIKVPKPKQKRVQTRRSVLFAEAKAKGLKAPLHATIDDLEKMLAENTG